MTAGIYYFTIEQGTYFERIFTWENPDGSPIDITGYVPKMQVRTAQGKLQKDLSEFLTVVEPTLGKVKLAIPDTSTELYDWDTANYDLKLVGDKPRRLIKGTVTIDPAETRDE